MKVRVASAGTGKTTSLVRRYLELIASGTPLRRVAGVTFTGVAAAELRGRVATGVRLALLEGRFLDLTFAAEERSLFEEAERELGGATISTIHGLMIAVLRLSAPLVGLDPDFTVLGEWEAGALFEEELAALLYIARDPGHGLYGHLQRLGEGAEGLVLQLFRERSLAERYTLAPEAGETERALLTLFDRAYARYRARLGAGLLAPAEVERRALALTRHPAALARLRGRYHVLLVDEFQDVNPVQGAFFGALEGAGIATEVVGDPKQSIYGFRHADVEVFRRALAHGEVQPPLQETRRHARVITRFLNHLTRSFAARSWGFSPVEASDVRSVGPQADARGRVEIHWVTGERAIGELRASEAEVLAGRLASLVGRYEPREMAVLARSYVGLAQMERALRACGLPAVMLQGRGYFERLEIRDLYHALQVGLDPKGYSLAAWLRGPFAGLSLAELERVTEAEDPLLALQRFPDVFGRLERLREAVRAPPLEALKFLIRDPFIGGKRYVDFLGPCARENVDAFLFTVASGPPQEVGVLLERLERLSRQADAGDVPQSGDGVKLLTIHRAKGLEWPVVALFDLGRFERPRSASLYVASGSGQVALKGGAAFHELARAARARETEESYRLLYVAASRARDVLLLSGSVKAGRPEGWAAAVSALGFGPDASSWARGDFVLQTWPVGPTSAPAPSTVEAPPPTAAPWTHRRFRRPERAPLSSPSGVKGDLHPDEHEPLPVSDPDEGERLPGRSRAVGTLVHYAISQNWSARSAAHLDNLRAQEVMFPFSAPEQDDIVAEVAHLLGRYEALLGAELPGLEEREADLPELPFALPYAGTVWQGIIDRLYCARGRWYLEDYKTDCAVRPEVYHVQLALYARAVQEVRGVLPEVRLVYLRAGALVRVAPEVLRAALGAALGAALEQPPASPT